MFDKKMVYHVLDYYSDSHFNNDNMVSKIISHLEDNVISIADATILCNEKRIEQIRNISLRSKIAAESLFTIRRTSHIHTMIIV